SSIAFILRACHLLPSTVFHEETKTREDHEELFSSRMLRVLRIPSCLRGEPSYDLCERVAEPIEHPVAGDEEDDRHRRKRQEPFPVTDGVMEKENLLIAHRKMRERVCVEQRLESLQARLEPGVEDRCCKEPQREHVCEKVANIAEMDGERREDQCERCGKHELNQHGNRKPQQVPRRGRPKEREKEKKNGQAKKEMHHVCQHADDGQHFGREENFLDEIAAGNQRSGRLAERR